MSFYCFVYVFVSIKRNNAALFRLRQIIHSQTFALNIISWQRIQHIFYEAMAVFFYKM